MKPIYLIMKKGREYVALRVSNDGTWACMKDIQETWRPDFWVTDLSKWKLISKPFSFKEHVLKFIRWFTK